MSEEIQTRRFLEQSVSRYKKELGFATKTAENSALVVPLSTTPRSIGGFSDVGTSEFKGLSGKSHTVSSSTAVGATANSMSAFVPSTPTTTNIPNTFTPLSERTYDNSAFELRVQPFVPSFLSSRNKENVGSGNGYTPATPVKRGDMLGSKESDKTVAKPKPEIDDKLDLRAIELETLEISKRIERLKGVEKLDRFNCWWVFGMGTSSLQQQTSSDGLIVSQRSFLDSSKGGAGTNRFFYEDSATK